MNHHTAYAVITTIQPPTRSVRCLCERLIPAGIPLIVIGDEKGPWDYQMSGTELVDLTQQEVLPFALASLLPKGHYARKNLGYLLAISRGATCIYETDDDNLPLASWRVRQQTVTAQKVAPRPWLNAYRFFTDEFIWPRGFPLELVRNPTTYAHDLSTPQESVDCPIQQGLVDLSPDVDATWRLLLGRDFHFQPRPSIWLPPGTWCPFNSQSTWWWPTAYALMYLPSHCSCRMTDIWRSFIAQRCLWELDNGMVFHGAETIQNRNAHNLLWDFRDELPGYLNNQKIIDTLAKASLCKKRNAVTDNLLICYDLLITNGFIDQQELPIVQAWCDDLSRAMP